MQMCKELIDRLRKESLLKKEEYAFLIENREQCRDYLFENSSAVAKSIYSNKVYIRGLIEFTNYCKNNCYYCGIRRENMKVSRYRLTQDEILQCAEEGYKLGFRTFVLQGGEDVYFKDEKICSVVKALKTSFPDCAVTLSIGEKSRKSYEAFKNAGADRYLLRHETADSVHYSKLHPAEMSFENRMRCLEDLKMLGFQTGAGFMVGSPYQTVENLAEELIFLKRLNPEMVGIGPFISHKDTPFCNMQSSSAELTVFMLGLIRLTLPHALIPATTALATVDENGRIAGIKAGANVVMPNLSPENVRGKYTLYNKKAYSGTEAAQGLIELKTQLEKAGYEVVTDRGDYKP